MKAVSNPNWVVRYRALEALTIIPDSRVDPLLINALHDERDHVRYMAAKGLGNRKVQHAIAPLIQCLEDENEFVRICVVRSLAALGNIKAVPPLQNRIQRETVKRVVEEMKKVLSQFESTDYKKER